ncbi:PPR: pentatricopeptide repeat domain containing protein [Nitzschia inconspicua]|uniref:PPR: pentatricopeptide repeat domain containing protein n=1 Tax=Nitzschia inconspicua TaxID=303405 RepID=A0A9K3LV09_9STRA|nr:PPR: pentatricopeptide repeat domain containing protein [Nitzschia inconspicua]
MFHFRGRASNVFTIPTWYIPTITAIASVTDSKQFSFQDRLFSAATIRGKPTNKSQPLKDIDTADIEALIKKTHNFVPILHAFFDDSRRENFELFNEWRRVLFRIRQNDESVLVRAAESINALLYANLDDQSFTIDVSNAKSWMEFVATGIYAWGRLARLRDFSSKAPENAEALVGKLYDMMKINYDKLTEGNLDAALYSSMVYCWSQAAMNANASERALYWFERLEEMDSRNRSQQESAVSSETWAALLRILVKQDRFQDAKTQELLQKYDHLNSGYTYVSLVRGLMQQDSKGEEDNLKTAYNVLQRGISHCMQQSQDSQMAALHQLLFEFLNDCADHRDLTPNAFSTGEQVLEQIITMQQNQPHRYLIQRIHFAVVMRALASRGEARKVQRLFQTMRMLYGQTGNPQLQPDDQVIVILLSALAKTYDRKHLASIEKLLLLTENYMSGSLPRKASNTNHAYNIVLDFYSKVPNVRDRRRRIERLMTRMEELAEQYDNAEFLPDRVSYAALLRAIIVERQDDFVHRVQEVLERMELSDRSTMLPDANVYALALDAFFKSGDKKLALVFAKKVFRRIKRDSRVLPDEVLFTLLMKIYSLVEDAAGSDRVLFEMIDAYENQGRDDCCPTEVSFVTAMSSWERSQRYDAPERALDLFDTMMTLYKNGNDACRPGQKIFGQLMVILAKSNYRSKLQVGRKLLRTMKELSLEPDLMVLNWYIHVCASGSGGSEESRKECWKDAKATLIILRERKRGPNSQTYNSLLYACHNLFQDPAQSKHEMKWIFDQCKEDGLLDRRFAKTLKKLLPRREYEEWTNLNATWESSKIRTIPDD